MAEKVQQIAVESAGSRGMSVAGKTDRRDFGVGMVATVLAGICLKAKAAVLPVETLRYPQDALRIETIVRIEARRVGAVVVAHRTGTIFWPCIDAAWRPLDISIVYFEYSNWIGPVKLIHGKALTQMEIRRELEDLLEEIAVKSNISRDGATNG